MNLASLARRALGGLSTAVLLAFTFITSAFHAVQADIFMAQDYVDQSRDPYFWDDMFRRVTPNRAPYVTFTANMKQRSVTSHRFYHFVEDVIGHKTYVSATINNSTTTLPVGDYTLIIAGHMLLCPSTGEIFYVTATPSSGNVTVATRPFGGTATAITFTNATDPNMELWVLGNVSKEGSNAPDRQFKEIENNYNLVMEQRIAWELTSLAMETGGLRGPEELGRLARVSMERFKEEQERICFFSKRVSATISGGLYRSTGGLEEWITAASPSRVMDLYGSVLTQETWEDICEKAFENVDGSIDTMAAFVGPKASTALNQSRMGLVPMKAGDTYGVRTAAYEGQHGRINLILNRQFTGFYAGHIFIFPLSKTRKATMTGIEQEKNLQDNDAKVRKDGLYQAWGLDRGLAQHMFLVRGAGLSPRA